MTSSFSNLGVRNTSARASFRCDGSRPSDPATTSSPLRWAWKNVTPSATSRPYSPAPSAIRNFGDVAAAAPLTWIRYVPGFVTDLKSIGYTAG
jgi:hypothetical protein